MEDEEETTGYLIPDKVYDVLKWVGLIALPASAVCVQTSAPPRAGRAPT